ncbi:hypothetical protein ACL1FJ_00535 [Corynebacterium striatum]
MNDNGFEKLFSTIEALAAGLVDEQEKEAAETKEDDLKEIIDPFSEGGKRINLAIETLEDEGLTNEQAFKVVYLYLEQIVKGGSNGF